MHGISFDVDGQWYDIEGGAAVRLRQYAQSNPRITHRLSIILLFIEGYTFHRPVAPSKVIVIS